MRRHPHSSSARSGAVGAWLLFAAGCAVLPNERGADCATDGRCPDGFACFPDFRCYEYDADPPCKPPCYGAEPYCDKQTLRCIECRDDADCAVGAICAPALKRCRPGCSETRPECPPGERCDVGAGQCLPTGTRVGCQGDGTCTDPFKPRCHGPSGQCVSCLPGGTDCPSGSFCVESQGSFRCMQGCTSASECPAGGPGQVMDCCDHRCVDVLSESGHCGACRNACSGADACCDGVCTDLTRSASNCGGCGRSCYLPNVTGVRCMNSTCSNRGCEQYFGNCDGNLASNGCEVNHSFSAIHCGSCGNVCSAPPHRQPSCIILSCSWSGPCEAGWGDCDGNSANGCERPLTTTTDCGGCSASCAANQSCVGGECR